MSEDQHRITPKDAKETLDLQKSIMLEQQQRLLEDTRENREEYVEMTFNVPLSLTGKLASYYSKLYKDWMDQE